MEKYNPKKCKIYRIFPIIVVCQKIVHKTMHTGQMWQNIRKSTSDIRYLQIDQNRPLCKLEHNLDSIGDRVNW